MPEAETTAWVAAVVGDGGTVSAYRQTLVDNLIVSLKADGVFTKLDRLFLLKAQNSQGALRDLVGANAATAVNSPTFTVDVGYAGNGTDSDIDLGFNPTSGTPLYAQNSAHFSVWNLTNATPNGGLVGNHNGAASWQFFFNDSYVRVNDGGGSFVLVDPRGFLLGNRTNSADRQSYQNGSQINTTSVASDILQNLNFHTCSYGNGGFLTNQISAASIGGGLTGTEITNFYSRMDTYMTAVDAGEPAGTTPFSAFSTPQLDGLTVVKMIGY